jgi:hypothetical protein
MTSASLKTDTLDLLAASAVRNELVSELDGLKGMAASISKQQVAVVLGQWFHPLHYFPVFLSRLISVSPELEMKLHICRILWQELGEGDIERAHEKIYVDTMVDVGFDGSDVADALPFEATERLVEGYRQSSADYLSGLGFMYGTEVADLAMVSTIGKLVRQCTGRKGLPWVDIHVQQEPGHVESSSKTLMPTFTEADQTRIIQSAEQMWRLWANFFGSVRQAVS